MGMPSFRDVKSVFSDLWTLVESTSQLSYAWIALLFGSVLLAQAAVLWKARRQDEPMELVDGVRLARTIDQMIVESESSLVALGTNAALGRSAKSLRMKLAMGAVALRRLVPVRLDVDDRKGLLDLLNSLTPDQCHLLDVRSTKMNGGYFVLANDDRAIVAIELGGATIGLVMRGPNAAVIKGLIEVQFYRGRRPSWLKV